MPVFNGTCKRDASMDDDLAWQIVRVVFRSSRELQDLLGLLKDRASTDD